MDEDKLNKELDQLQKQCGDLLNLLRDRHVGLVSWRYLVGQRAAEINQTLKDLGMVE